ncbi:hypothetical protein P12x_002128 [Tundrisphaera lichenicola]|uniref:hypothetical protein n=1 Tax=Tundrisphaera lichenicola TaxID=2029860 RepID=UPI003EBFDD44
MHAPVTRRAFLATSTTGLAAVAIPAWPASARVVTRPEPTGPVYGRTGHRGIPAGSTSAPSAGDVALLDGRILRVSHESSRGIGARKSVLLSPDRNGRWSILYAEC